jgi:hypothetical protein
VESPCLSILVPLLVKGLREKAAVVRKTAVIIDNMVKVRRTLANRASDPSSMQGQVPACRMTYKHGAVCSPLRDHTKTTDRPQRL